MSTVNFLKATIDKVGVDNLINNLANQNYDFRVYSRLIFGLDKITQQDVEAYVMKKEKSPVRKVTYEISTNLLDLYNLNIHYELQEFRYINEKNAIPEDMNIKDFDNYCIEHKIDWANELSDSHSKSVSVWVEATIYRPIEEVVE